MSWLGKIHPFHLSKTAVAVMVVLGLYVGAQAALYRVSEPKIECIFAKYPSNGFI